MMHGKSGPIALCGVLAALDEMRSELTARGVNVLKQTFVCSGKGGLFSGGHAPNETDLENARKFAADCIKQVMGE